MLNPDGRVWIDRLADGQRDTPDTIAADDGERIIRVIAHHVDTEAHAGLPRLSAELPGSGERFEGLLPPVVANPSFSIRKPASVVFTLDAYVRAGTMTRPQADALRSAVLASSNSRLPQDADQVFASAEAMLLAQASAFPPLHARSGARPVPVLGAGFQSQAPLCSPPLIAQVKSTI